MLPGCDGGSWRTHAGPCAATVLRCFRLADAAATLLTEKQAACCGGVDDDERAGRTLRPTDGALRPRAWGADKQRHRQSRYRVAALLPVRSPAGCGWAHQRDEAERW